MPRSKKPRKGYVKKGVRMPFVRRRTLDDLTAELERVEIAVRMKLHLGKCDAQDLFEVREIFNMAMFGLTHRQLVYCESAELMDQTAQAGIYLSRLRERGDKLGRFVCKAEELELLPPTISNCIEFVRMSLQDCPFTMLDEMHGAMLLVAALPPGGAFKVDADVTDFAFREARHLGQVELKRLARECELSVLRIRQKMDGKVIFEGT